MIIEGNINEDKETLSDTTARGPSPKILTANNMKSEGEDHNVGRCRFMMKNIASLLTTASVYAGINKAQDANQFAQEHESFVDTLVEAPKSLEESECFQSSLKDASSKHCSKVTKSKIRLQNYDSSRTTSSGSFITKSRGQRKPTPFDFSIEPSFSKGTSNDKTHFQYQNDKVAQKLMTKFKIAQDDKFVNDYPAWLLKDVLVQGTIFLTHKHLLFFAYLPSNDDRIQLSGNLNVVPRLGGTNRYWCILKRNSLIFYASPTKLYYPIMAIDLRNDVIVKAEKEGKNGATNHFSLSDSKRCFRLSADSGFSAKAWINAIKIQQFANQNTKEDSVSLKIPLSTIESVDEQDLVNAATTLTLFIKHTVNGAAHEDYVFMFFDNAGSELRTSLTSALAENGIENANMGSIINTSLSDRCSNEAGNANNRPSSASVTDIPVSDVFHSTIDNELNAKNCSTNFDIEDEEINDSDAEIINDTKLKESKKHTIASLSSGHDWKLKSLRYVRDMWHATPLHYFNDKFRFEETDPYLVKGPNIEIDNEHYRRHFGMHEKERLISTFYCYLFKTSPIYGKLYLTANYVCFRSLVLRSRSKMVLPITEILSSSKESGIRFGYYGVAIALENGEEIFIEFGTETSQIDFDSIAGKLIKNSNKTVATFNSNPFNVIEHNEKSSKLKLFVDKISGEGFDVPLLLDQNPYYKTTIKPRKSYSIALLTIGSRGDVQPYLALAKGLIAEGHIVTIITHLEFKNFVESRGVNFRSIAGNPAELMALMVEHESINVGMLRDAATRFRGWIDELLESSWAVCRDLQPDLLIESPSAMCGIHIAEALQLPYFRAFTMPWTRTRAYPHAFIVPDQKRGGNYNYMTHVLFENVFWKGISSQVNRWRVETLGLNKTNLYQLQQNKIPFLYNISPTLFPPALDFSEWVKVTGYWFLDESSNYKPPEDLQAFIKKTRDTKKKLVYIGFGSIVVSDAKEMTKALADAVKSAGVNCILNKGWSDRLNDQNSTEPEIDLPDCIFNAGSLPHDWLFPLVDAAVHHGGSGTTGATLRAGVPTIIKPFFGDQFFYASRVEEAGVGIALKSLNKNTLSAALTRATTDQYMAERARNLRDQIVNENGVTIAINCLYSELEYARSVTLERCKINKRSPFCKSSNPVGKLALALEDSLVTI